MQAGPGIVELDREEVAAALAAGTMLLVDVREPHEFTAGHIPGSLSMPLSRFDPGALPQDEGRPVVFSCAAGIRSLHAIAAAQAAGLPLNSHYRGGFKDWASAGLPVAFGED